jgi:hypothetical protein
MKENMSMRSLFAALFYLCTITALAPTIVVATDSISMSAVSGAPSAVQPQGRFEIFVANPGSDGAIFHTWQNLNQAGWNSRWQPYYPIPDNNPHGLVSGRDGKGRIAVAWIAKGAIYFEEALSADASLPPTSSPIGPTTSALKIDATCLRDRPMRGNLLTDFEGFVMFGKHIARL